MRNLVVTIVGATFLMASVAFADEQPAAEGGGAKKQKAGIKLRPGAARGPATTKRPLLKGLKKRKKADAAQMGQCREGCIGSKTTGEDRLACFRSCRQKLGGGVPYVDFKACNDTRRQCVKDACGETVAAKRAVTGGDKATAGQRKTGGTAATSCRKPCFEALKTCKVDVLSKAQASGESKTTTGEATTTTTEPAKTEAAAPATPAAPATTETKAAEPAASESEDE